MQICKPKPCEYDPRYEKYFQLVTENDLLPALRSQANTTNALLDALQVDKIDRPFADGEWTPMEIVGHLLDTERIFGYRLLCFARGDATPLERADQDLYVRNAKFELYSFPQLVTEFILVRKSHLSLFENLPVEGWDRRGTVSGLLISVRAIAYLLLGHERHHLLTIRDHYA